MVSKRLQVSPAAVGSSVRGQLLKTHRPEACSSSEDASGLSSHRRAAGSGCCRSATPSVSDYSGLCTYLQGHQRNLAFQSEVRSAAALRSHAVSQSQIFHHLMKRKLLPNPSKLAMLECLPIQFLKIKLCKREIG